MKIGIGTAQFGLDYGITNEKGQMSSADALSVLSACEKAGFDYVDTSPAYGLAETVLGNYPKLRSFKVITKTINAYTSEMTNEKVDVIASTFLKSLETMNIDQCYGLLVHNPADLKSYKAKRLIGRLKELKEQKKVQKIGVSVYNINDIEQAKSIFEFDLIQLPLNIFNQDLNTSGMLKVLKQDGVEIHARSVFLQGIALSRPENLPEHLMGLAPPLSRLIKCSKKYGVSCAELCIEYIRQVGLIDVAIVGVNSLQQLSILSSNRNIKSEKIDWSEYQVYDSNLTNPINWPKCK